MTNKLIVDQSKFWLGKHIDPSEIQSGCVTDLLRLSACRRAISNFVYILTGKNIPVRFAEKSESITNGKIIYIGGELSRGEIDPTVGLCLHEAAHIVKSDFNLIKTAWGKIPRNLVSAAKKTGVDSFDDIGKLSAYVLNIVEDRYIDAWVQKTAPGYKGYYRALYDKYFNLPEIDEALRSNKYRECTVYNYKFRLVNFTNPNTDLDALPALREISKLLDLNNILRDELSTPQDRLKLAFSIVEKIFEHGITHDEVAENENNTATKTNTLFKKQENFVSHEQEPSAFSSAILKKLQILEDAEVSTVTVGGELGIPKIECIVVENMTRNLLESGEFPYVVSSIRSLRINPQADAGVKNGIALGVILGRKLQIRGDVKITKFNRLNRGRIDRRRLAQIGCQSEDLFYQTAVDKYKNIHLHISVDASSSMTNNWKKTITAVVAITKAASMINNVSVSISFRSGVMMREEEIPYIVLAYDSHRDKFSKIVDLFPMLFANGSTPEGLAFQAILNRIPIATYELDSYFLNISDGEPFFGSIYNKTMAAQHTRKQVCKIRATGVDVLSYFITNTNVESTAIAELFKTMYGADSRFIDVENITQIAVTLNNKFLAKEN